MPSLRTFTKWVAIIAAIVAALDILYYLLHPTSFWILMFVTIVTGLMWKLWRARRIDKIAATSIIVAMTIVVIVTVRICESYSGIPSSTPRATDAAKSAPIAESPAPAGQMDEIWAYPHQRVKVTIKKYAGLCARPALKDDDFLIYRMITDPQGKEHLVDPEPIKYSDSRKVPIKPKAFTTMYVEPIRPEGDDRPMQILVGNQ